jgi:hypothetical protein
MVFLPALLFDAPFTTQVLFYPAKIYSEPYSCDMLSIADYLNQNFDKNVDINVPDWDTAGFLYETHLKVDFLANYPSHDHFIDNKIFFASPNMDLVRHVAYTHNFDLVAACVIVPMSAEAAESHNKRSLSLIERLGSGSQPSWLIPIPLYFPTNYRLFAVDKKEVAREEGVK